MSLCTSRSSGAYRASEVAINVFDRLWVPDGSKRGVVFAHGYNVLADVYLTMSSIFPIFEQGFTSNGLAGTIPDLGGLSTWGNDTAQAAVTDAKAWLGAAPALGCKTDKVLLHGGSMGSLAVLNWAIAHPTLVAAIVCELPLNDLVDVHANATYTSIIETAYGGTAAYNAAAASHNPAANAAALAGIPTLLVYSTDDPIVTPSTVTALAATIGSSAQVVSLGAVGHSATSADRKAQGAFLRAAA